jgi:hypothetical protein
MSAIRSLSGTKRTSDNNAEQSRFISIIITRPNARPPQYLAFPGVLGNGIASRTLTNPVT